MPKKVLVSHPTGNPNVRAVLRSLVREYLLHSFHTSLAFKRCNHPGWLSGMYNEFVSPRTFPEVLESQLHLYPIREAIRLLGLRLNLKSLFKHETGLASVDAVYRAIDRHVAMYVAGHKDQIMAVYAYEDNALKTFSIAEELGLKRIYDLPTPYWRKARQIQAEEAERWPEWQPTMPLLSESAKKVFRKDQEILLADQILVASNFSRDSLLEYFGDSKSITVVPYGCPPLRHDLPPDRKKNEPLRILYAGHLSQRKGLAYLVAACTSLEIDWQLVLAGPQMGPMPDSLESFLSDPRCKWLGPVRHSKLLQVMRDSHLFVFPALCEGFGLVLSEALASGLPLISTANTAAPDLLSNSSAGFIVPIRSPSAIAEKITWIYEHEHERRSMAANALSIAKQRSWLVYEKTLASMILRTAQA